MLKFVKAQLASGRQFASEGELVKYLNSLRGYLTRKNLLSPNWKKSQAAILNSYRKGTLRADPVPASKQNAS